MFVLTLLERELANKLSFSAARNYSIFIDQRNSHFPQPYLFQLSKAVEIDIFPGTYHFKGCNNVAAAQHRK